jgi:hypothetical protein
MGTIGGWRAGQTHPLPIAALPGPAREMSRAIDRHFGNDDGYLEGGELQAFAVWSFPQPHAYGAVPELSRLMRERPSPPSAASKMFAARMVRPGGSGTSEDAARVADGLSQVPAGILRHAESAGVRVVACRGSIVDYAPELAAQSVRGAGAATWDQVPGIGWARGDVVIATRGDPVTGERVVPRMTQSHLAFDLVLHEFAHGLDVRGALGSVTSMSPGFIQAYLADYPRLGVLGTYYVQPGEAGLQEAFAESFARYFAGDPGLESWFPSLFGFWRSFESGFSTVE